jgi:hypothetical protein
MAFVESVPKPHQSPQIAPKHQPVKLTESLIADLVGCSVYKGVRQSVLVINQRERERGERTETGR